MLFDKINFVLNVLSSETILSGVQNNIKLFVKDSISDTEISKVSYSILSKDGRNDPIVIQDWTELVHSGTFYNDSVTPTLTESKQLELAVKVEDTLGNEYYLSTNLEGVIR